MNGIIGTDKSGVVRPEPFDFAQDRPVEACGEFIEPGKRGVFQYPVTDLSTESTAGSEDFGFKSPRVDQQDEPIWDQRLVGVRLRRGRDGTQKHLRRNLGLPIIPRPFYAGG